MEDIDCKVCADDKHADDRHESTCPCCNTILCIVCQHVGLGHRGEHVLPLSLEEGL